MAFKLPKTEMSWSELYFFLLKIREGKSWLVRGLIALGIALLMFGAIQIDQNRAQRLGLLNALWLSAAAGLVRVGYADVGNIQRDVTIRDDGIIYNSTVNMGIYWHGSFEFEDFGASASFGAGNGSFRDTTICPMAEWSCTAARTGFCWPCRTRCRWTSWPMCCIGWA